VGGQRFLSNALVEKLCESSVCTLNQIGDVHQSTLWQQHWYSTLDIGLEVHWFVEWIRYIFSLRKDHVHLFDIEGEFVWSFPNS